MFDSILCRNNQHTSWTARTGGVVCMLSLVTLQSCLCFVLLVTEMVARANLQVLDARQCIAKDPRKSARYTEQLGHMGTENPQNC